MTKPVNIREVVLGIIIDVFEKNKYSHVAINDALKKIQSSDKQERSFLTKLAEGTIEKVIELDFIINSFSKINTKKMKPVIRNILRMSVYQIKYMDSVPDSAVCNEAVTLTAKKGFTNLKGFVNGVLRNIARGINDIKYPDSLSIKYSMPEWLTDLWLRDYGEEDTMKILEGLDVERKTTVRCNLSKASKQDIIKSLKEQGIIVEETTNLEEALYISNYDNISSIKAHKEGLIQVQDISSMFVARYADIKKGDYIIDVCAAPGGKALHAADLLFGTGKVEARDVSENKVKLIDENIERAGFTNINSCVKDAIVFYPESEKTADILLADLPCSGLGIISKKSDIKYKASEEAISELVKLQKEILKTVYKYVKPGGVLIYSTCTINKSENQNNAEWFKDNFPFEEESFLQILPGVIDSDGFFIAKFRRKLDGQD